MRTLKSFEFTSGGAKGSYDWDKLLDGSIYQLEEGKDFQCEVNTLISMARKQAKKKGKGLRTQKVEGGVVIQAVEDESAK